MVFNGFISKLFEIEENSASVFFQSDSGKIYKKFRVSYRPMMCVPNSHMKEVCDVVSSPFECHITYSRAGFSDLMSHSTKNYISGMEQSHCVQIQPYVDYVRIRGCIFELIEAVKSKLEKRLELHLASSSHVPNAEVSCSS